MSQRFPVTIASDHLWWFMILGPSILATGRYLNNTVQLSLMVNKTPEVYKKLPLSMWYVTSHWKPHPNELTKRCAVLFSLRTFCFLCNTAGTEDILDVFKCPIFLAWNVVSLATWDYENLLFHKNRPHAEFKGPKHNVLLLDYIYHSP